MELNYSQIETHYGATYREALAAFTIHPLYPIWGNVFFAASQRKFLQYPKVFNVPDHVWAKLKDHHQALRTRLITELLEAEQKAPGRLNTPAAIRNADLPGPYVAALFDELFTRRPHDNATYGTSTPVKDDGATGFLQGMLKDPQVFKSALGINDPQIWQEYKTTTPAKSYSFHTFENWLAARATPLLHAPWMTMQLNDSAIHLGKASQTRYKAPVWVAIKALLEGITGLHPSAAIRIQIVPDENWAAEDIVTFEALIATDPDAYLADTLVNVQAINT